MSIGLDAPILPTSPNHEDWIKKALRLAGKAFSEGEVPVGAIIVKDNKIIGYLRSAAYSPRFKKVVGIAMILDEFSREDFEFNLNLDKKKIFGKICKLPME